VIVHTIAVVTTYDEDRVIVLTQSQFALELDDSDVAYDGPFVAGLDVFEAIAETLSMRLHEARALERGRLDSL